MKQLSLGIQAVTILHTVKKVMRDKKEQKDFTLYQTVCLIPAISDEPIIAWPQMEFKVGSVQKLEVTIAPKSDKEMKIKLSLPTINPTSDKT